jgi:regulator of replication initiation timing
MSVNRRQQLLERIKELEAENTELRKRLGEDVTPTEIETDGNAKFVSSGESGLVQKPFQRA